MADEDPAATRRGYKRKVDVAEPNKPYRMPQSRHDDENIPANEQEVFVSH